MVKKVRKEDSAEFHYGYDAFDRLVSFQSQAADATPLVRAEYGYDPLGRRIKKQVEDLGTASTVTKNYVHSGWNVFLELDETREVRRHYVGLGSMDVVLGFVEGGQLMDNISIVVNRHPIASNVDCVVGNAKLIWVEREVGSAKCAE